MLFSRFIPTLALAVMLSLPTADAEARTGNASPHLQPIINAVVARGQRGIGRPMARGIVLRKVEQIGNIISFTGEVVDPGMERFIRNNRAAVQRQFVKSFGKGMCGKGKATRRFIDAGGQIQFIMRNKARKNLVGGRVTRC